MGAIYSEIATETQLVILNLLVTAGADINKTFTWFGDENDRFTVLDHAVLYDVSQTVIGFLESRGAKHHRSLEQISKLKSELRPRRIV